MLVNELMLFNSLEYDRFNTIQVVCDHKHQKKSVCIEIYSCGMDLK